MHGPIIAASDYVRALLEMVRAFLPAGRRYITLGTDGFGRSDSRAALRSHFEVDARAIVQASMQALGDVLATENAEHQKRLEDAIAQAVI